MVSDVPKSPLIYVTQWKNLETSLQQAHIIIPKTKLVGNSIVSRCLFLLPLRITDMTNQYLTQYCLQDTDRESFDQSAAHHRDTVGARMFCLQNTSHDPLHVVKAISQWKTEGGEQEMSGVQRFLEKFVRM